jgi:Rha family phage regulatory protein
VEDGEIRISTVDIASWLERPHKNVLREIEAMLQDYRNTEQLGRLTCEPSSYINEQNKEQPMFDMDVRTALKFVTRLKGQKPRDRRRHCGSRNQAL